MGIELTFIQQGVRNNDGYYQLTGWGPLDADWIDQHSQQILEAIT